MSPGRKPLMKRRAISQGETLGSGENPRQRGEPRTKERVTEQDDSHILGGDKGLKG